MRGLPRILWLFRDELNKLNNTGARLLCSIYSFTTLKARLKFALSNAFMLLYNYTRNQYGCHNIALPKIVNHKWFIKFNACRYITPLINTNQPTNKQTNKQTNK